MKDGDYEWIIFINQDNEGVKARLLDTDVSNPGTPIQHTGDPDWSVIAPDGTNPQVKKIYVLATDGSVRAIWTDASWYGPEGNEPIPFHPYIATHFHISRPDGSEEREDREFWFIDPSDRQPYRVTVNNLGIIPGRPTFHVSH